MHIPGLFPLQAWMDRVQGHISRGENNKARFSALLLPVFEAVGCISMVGRICFRSARNREEDQGSFSLLSAIGKTALLAVNILFATYYGLKNPKGNLDYHRLAGLITAPQEKEMAEDSPTFLQDDLNDDQSLFDEEQHPRNFTPQHEHFADDYHSPVKEIKDREEVHSPTKPTWPIKSPSRSPISSLKKPITFVTPPGDAEDEFDDKPRSIPSSPIITPRTSFTSSPQKAKEPFKPFFIEETPQNLDQITLTTIPEFSNPEDIQPVHSPRSISSPSHSPMKSLASVVEQKENIENEEIDSPICSPIKIPTTPFANSPENGNDLFASLSDHEESESSIPVFPDVQEIPTKKTLLVQSALNPVATVVEEKEDLNALPTIIISPSTPLKPPSTLRTVTVTPIKPSPGIQSLLAKLHQQSSPTIQKIDANLDIEQERARQLLYQTPTRSPFTPKSAIKPIPLAFPSDILPTPSHPPKEEIEVVEIQTFEQRQDPQTSILPQEPLEPRVEISEESSEESSYEESDNVMSDLFILDSHLLDVKSDQENEEGMTTLELDSHEVDLSPLPSLSELSNPPIPIKLTGRSLNLGEVKSSTSDIEFNTPEKHSSKSTHSVFSWLTDRNINFDQPFELKYDEKKDVVHLKIVEKSFFSAAKTKIDPKFIVFLQKKLDEKAFDTFVFSPLYALRSNLQKMMEKGLIKDKGTTLSSVEKRLTELITKWWIKEDYRKQKLSEDCRLLIQYVMSKHYLDEADKKSEGRTSERLMRQSNPPQTSQNLEKFHFHDKNFVNLSIYDHYAVLKTFLMNFPPEQEAIFAGCQQSDSKASLIEAIKAIPNPADRALAVDLVSLLWATLYKVWAPEDGLNLDELNDDNREKFCKIANSMLIGGNAIASLLCPSQVTQIKMGLQTFDTKTPIHTHLIELILDYPLHFEELSKSVIV